MQQVQSFKFSHQLADNVSQAVNICHCATKFNCYSELIASWPITKSTLILQKATPLNFTVQICLRRPFQGELIWWNSTLAEVYFLMTKKRKVKKKPKKAVNPVYFLMTKKRKVKKLKKQLILYV